MMVVDGVSVWRTTVGLNVTSVMKDFMAFLTANVSPLQTTYVISSDLVYLFNCLLVIRLSEIHVTCKYF